MKKFKVSSLLFDYAYAIVFASVSVSVRLIIVCGNFACVQTQCSSAFDWTFAEVICEAT